MELAIRAQNAAYTTATRAPTMPDGNARNAATN